MLTPCPGIQPPTPRTGSQTETLDPHGIEPLLLPRRDATPPSHPAATADRRGPSSPARGRPHACRGDTGWGRRAAAAGPLQCCGLFLVFFCFFKYVLAFGSGFAVGRAVPAASAATIRRQADITTRGRDEGRRLPPTSPRGAASPRRLRGGRRRLPLPRRAAAEGRLPPLSAGVGAEAAAFLRPGLAEGRRAGFRGLPADERGPAAAAGDPGEGAGGILPVPGAVLPPPAAAAVPLRCAGRWLVPTAGGQAGGAGGSSAPPPGVRPAAAAARRTDAPAGDDEELWGALQRCHPACADGRAASPRGGARPRPLPRSAPAGVMPPPRSPLPLPG